MTTNSFKDRIDFIINTFRNSKLNINKNKVFIFLYYFLIMCPLIFFMGLITLIIHYPYIFLIMIFIPYVFLIYFKILKHFKSKNNKDYIDVEYEMK